MKLKKILTAFAAAAAMTSLLAVGAFAADDSTPSAESTSGSIKNVSYNATTGEVTFDIPTALTTALGSDKDMTLVILDASKDESMTITDAKIMQIDQNSPSEINAKLAKGLTDAKFYVLLGGDGKLYTSSVYEITDGSDTPELILVGDVNGNGEVNGLDASALAMYTAKVGTIADKYFDAADVNDNGEVNGLDASALAMYVADAGELCCTYTKDKQNTAIPPTTVEE